jgi:RHS repeat-associated protein
MIKGSDEFFFVKDQLGSIRLVVNSATGAIAQQIDYDEFGRVLSDSNPGFQPFGFAGGLYDHTTKLVRFGVRDYDPDIGRWTRKDPILFGALSINVYQYAYGDPINYTDPSGNIGFLAAVGIGAAVGAVAGAFGAYLGHGNILSGALSGAAGGAASVVFAGSAIVSISGITTLTGVVSGVVGGIIQGAIDGLLTVGDILPPASPQPSRCN